MSDEVSSASSPSECNGLSRFPELAELSEPRQRMDWWGKLSQRCHSGCSRALTTRSALDMLLMSGWMCYPRGNSLVSMGSLEQWVEWGTPQVRPRGCSSGVEHNLA